MLRSKIVSVVNTCANHGWVVVVIAAILTVLCGYYSARNFSIDTNVNKLISSELDWRKNELALDAAFPYRHEIIVAVVEAPTSELASQATAELIEKLATHAKVFKSVTEPAGGAFFSKNALLFASLDQTTAFTSQFAQARPLIQVLVSDQNWRGLVQGLSLALAGVQRNMYTLDAMDRPLTMFASTIEDAIAGRPASFSWRELAAGKSPTPSDLRRIIEIRPVLDFAALEPGEAATRTIRQVVADLKLDTEYRARVRLTGPIAIQDEEFGTLKENAELNAFVSLAFLVGILWLALRSAKIIAAVLISIFVGLAITAALGLALVGSLNPISVAFAVLFVGIGVDFGIQFSVRYRAERHAMDDLHVALRNAARHAGVPLTLAAAATAAGFLSFLPTDYKGLSELGEIAGFGMIVAFIVSVTLLPALLALMSPGGETEPLGYASLAPVDRFMERHRIPIIIGTAIVSLGGLPLLYFLQFDFNPMNLRSPKVESIATYLDLRRDPASGTNSVHVLAPSQAEAQRVAERLAPLPEADRVLTLNSLIPTDQDQKLALISQTGRTLEPAFKAAPRPAPSDAENIAALNRGTDMLTSAAGTQNGPGAEAAKRLAAALKTLATGDQAQRARAEFAFVSPLRTALAGLRDSFEAQKITADNIPSDIKMNWTLPDGRSRVEVHPKGDPNDNEVLRNFARAVLAIAPTASGGPIAILKSGDTVVHAFVAAGLWAFLSIAILLWIVLRRFVDVLLTLIPLLLAGVVTLEICVLIGLKLNFANIIALPLLLGVGVAFKIYYIMAWRAGQTGLLQSALTRAVIFSAMTTGTAFGSLWLSSHPGTSSMGKLLALSLVCTLAAAVLFQPVLMGPPREVGKP
jgi:hopanoid biosynthesis associated RND transporter like protein HpnN